MGVGLREARAHVTERRGGAVMLFCGIDASDQSLDFHLRDAGGKVLVEGRVPPSVAGLDEMLAKLGAFAPPSEIALALETAHAAYVQTMLDRGYLVYPVNPRTAAHFRKALSVSGEKSDRIDGKVLAMFLVTFHGELRPLRPDAPEIIALRIACEDRVRLVDERVAKINELQAILKVYYPAVLNLFGELTSQTALSFLEEYPTQKQMRALTPRQFKGFLRRQGYTHSQRLDEMLAHLHEPALGVADHLQQAKAHRLGYLVRSIAALNAELAARDKEIDQHFGGMPEADWIRSLPGAGPTLAPALLACIGRDQERFCDAGQARALLGTAPVTKASGRSSTVHMRRACWKFARRTLQLFAEQSILRGGWARAFYDEYRARGHGYHAALRAVAHKWVKIILAMKRTGSRYDEEVFLHSRRQHLSNEAVGMT